MYTFFVSDARARNVLVGWNQGTWTAEMNLGLGPVIGTSADWIYLAGRRGSPQELRFWQLDRRDLAVHQQLDWKLPEPWSALAAIAGPYPGLAVYGKGEALLAVIRFDAQRKPEFGLARFQGTELKEVLPLPGYLTISAPTLFATDAGAISVESSGVYAAASWTGGKLVALITPDLVRAAQGLSSANATTYYLGHSREFGPILISDSSSPPELGIALTAGGRHLLLQAPAAAGFSPESVRVYAERGSYVATMYVETTPGTGELRAVRYDAKAHAESTTQQPAAGLLRIIPSAPTYFFLDQTTGQGHVVTYGAPRFTATPVPFAKYAAEKVVALVDAYP